MGIAALRTMEMSQRRARKVRIVPFFGCRVRMRVLFKNWGMEYERKTMVLVCGLRNSGAVGAVVVETAFVSLCNQ